MRRRVEIARGLVHEPRIFFLDEPTTGLDPGVARRRLGDAAEDQGASATSRSCITTHYMDEADKLCDRIAIVDHGELKALDSPLKLKASIPGKNVARGQLRRRARRTGRSALERAARASRASPRTTTCSASRRATARRRRLALMEAAARRGVAVQSLSVQSTTLDDVFVHYTGRALRDALQDAVAAATARS